MFVRKRGYTLYQNPLLDDVNMFSRIPASETLRATLTVVNLAYTNCNIFEAAVIAPITQFPHIYDYWYVEEFVRVLLVLGFRV